MISPVEMESTLLSPMYVSQPNKRIVAHPVQLLQQLVVACQANTCLNSCATSCLQATTCLKSCATSCLQTTTGLRSCASTIVVLNLRGSDWFDNIDLLMNIFVRKALGWCFPGISEVGRSSLLLAERCSISLISCST